MHIRKRLVGLAAAGLATGLVLAACSGDDDGGGQVDQGFEDCLENPATCNSGDTEDGGEITFIISQPGTGWNLIGPSGGSVYSLQAMSGVIPSTGQDQPDGERLYNLDLLAEDPELVSEDPFTYVYKISEEAVWNDGTPITADDFIISWYMGNNPEEGYCDECTPRSPGGAELIESVVGSDNGKTVTVTLKEGEFNLEWIFDWGVESQESGLWPMHLAEEMGIDWQDPAQLGEYFTWLDETVPTWSGGPYQIVAEESSLDTRIVKERNPMWYGDPPPLERVVQEVLTDSGGYVTAYQNGEIDGGSPPDIASDVIQQLQGLEDVKVSVAPGPSWEHVDMNLGNVALQDVELRRAIFTAIDRANIAERNFGSVFPEYQLRNNYSFRQTHEFYVDHIEGTGFGTGDIEEARSILGAAGYEGFEEGAGPLTLDGEQVGPFRLRATETDPRETALTLIQDDLSQVGIEVNIEFTDALGETLVGQDYDIMLFGWSGSPNGFTSNSHQYAHPESPNNFGKYENEAYSPLAEQALSARTLEESAQFTNQAYEVLVPDAYILPLYDTPVYIFVRDDYVNVRDNGYASMRGMYNMGEWGIGVLAE